MSRDNTRTRASFRFIYVNRVRNRNRNADFSIERYGDKTVEKEECEEQLLAEYALMLAFYVSSVAALTGIAIEKDRLPKKPSLLDLALLGVATHKLSRIIAKDRITSILRAPFVNYIRSAGHGEAEEEPRGRGIQRGIGQLISCPYCMAAWCATALALGFIFTPRMLDFFAGIFAAVATSDFLHRAYAATEDE